MENTNVMDLGNLVSNLTDGFEGMANAAINAIGPIVTAVLPVLGAIIVIGILIKVVKRITGR